MAISFSTIDKKWQEEWKNANIWQSNNANPDKQKSTYILEMLPYPSGKLHIGHARNYTIGDIYCRFKIAMGYQVLHPMGWDSFGLPAENAAIKSGISPQKSIAQHIKNMKQQIVELGFLYDWSRELSTSDPDYYKHEQELFIKMYDKGIAYRKKSFVNWDPIDNTVLANEQVINGKGWRSGAKVEKKELSQWFLKITDYAEDLLSGLDKLKDWPESVKVLQKNWIGKSEGALINFQIKDKTDHISIFSTRPETIYGATFIAISHQHPLIKKYCQDLEIKTEILDSTSDAKIGIKTNLTVINPINNIELPIWIANFVLCDYGSGAVFGCPAHDERDNEFAKKYSIQIISVIGDNDKMINSDILNDCSIELAKKKILKYIVNNHIGKKSIHYKLRDWGISRQRYWGCPIPIIYCKKCGTVPVDIQNLPIKLPENVIFTGKGNPLENHPTWKYTKCHLCKGEAIRDTDTFDTFIDSSWYFLRYCSINSESILDEEVNKWAPVEKYIGGIEHAVLHLLYARFITRVMYDMKLVKVQEPFKGLLTQGMVLHPIYKTSNGEYVYPQDILYKNDALYDKNTNEKVVKYSSEKMSKSKKNIIALENIVAEYGADVLRLFLMSDKPIERDFEWSDIGIKSCKKFLDKLLYEGMDLKKEFENSDIISYIDSQNITIKTLQQVNQSIFNVTHHIDQFKFNTAIAEIRIMYNFYKTITNKYDKLYCYTNILQLIYPFTPHIAEEINSYFRTELLLKIDWPSYDQQLLSTTGNLSTVTVSVNGKMRDIIYVEIGLMKDEVINLAKQSSKISKHLDNQIIKQVIYIENKVLNFVI